MSSGRVTSAHCMIRRCHSAVRAGLADWPISRRIIALTSAADRQGRPHGGGEMGIPLRYGAGLTGGSASLFYSVFEGRRVLAAENRIPMNDVTTMPPPPVTEPDPSAQRAPGLAGPCAGCQRQTHRYGHGGLPLCQWCMASALEKYGPGVRFVNTRP